MEELRKKIKNSKYNKNYGTYQNKIMDMKNNKEAYICSILSDINQTYDNLMNHFEPDKIYKEPFYDSNELVKCKLISNEFTPKIKYLAPYRHKIDDSYISKVLDNPIFFDGSEQNAKMLIYKNTDFNNYHKGNVYIVRDANCGEKTAILREINNFYCPRLRYFARYDGKRKPIKKNAMSMFIVNKIQKLEDKVAKYESMLNLSK